MKRILITCCCLFLATALQAQQKGVSDSLYMYAQQQHEMRMIHGSATQLSTLTLQSTGMATLGFSYTGGRYRLAQEAEKTRLASFYTEGTARLGRFNIAGTFSFHRQWDDSLAYTLKGEDDGFSPYYYFVKRKGAYTRQQYYMHTILSYQLLKEKLFISTGIDYNYHWTTRSVDPRPDVNSFRLVLNPEITWRLKRHTLGAGIIWGYGQEKTGIVYKNKMMQNNNKDSSWVVFLNSGYGSFHNMRQQWNRDRKYHGFNASYAGAWSNWQLRATAVWNYLEEKNTINLNANNEQDYQPFSNWFKSNWRADLLLQQQTAARRQQFRLSWQAIRGKDEDLYITFRSNYLYRQQYIDAGWLLLQHPQQRLSIEWGARLIYNDRRQTDAFAAHTLHYRQLQPGISGTVYLTPDKRNRFHASISPSVRIPLQTDFTAPDTQENIFTNGVAYPDYHYWSATTLSTSLEAGWISGAIFREMKFGITARATLDNKLAMPAVKTSAYFIPGGHRVNAGLSVNLYF
ncbi:DUF6850 family outer membrane beta-barrel protein [Chitinophaga solisilvae]|uniref:DUF6850 family outer membrane beta-barrel protein n=1 Tax=Chitinophaga solisilvae TaxID=1233460 RepID=UPI0013681D7A|nr:DUF6850 family outer membrane beta-barrel protein [Chitinophaga solisilvae]